MLRSLQEIMELAKGCGPVTICVAGAQDKEVLEAVKIAAELGLAKAILVGDRQLIQPLLQTVGLPEDTPIIDEPDVTAAALAAVSLVRAGQAQVLMKGHLNSSDYLRAVLHPEAGLRTERLLSHLAVLEIPGQAKLLFITDTGMNVAPSLEEKKDILANALLALRALGIEAAKVAVLTANEVVNPKMPATVDAKALMDMEWGSAVVEGPIALDVAVNPLAAEHKGIASQVSGQADLFLFPTIEAGNIFGKALIHYAGAKNAGIILGASHPVILTSRADSAAAKVDAIALACAVANGLNKQPTEG